jgi:hypothetical protein
MATAYVSPSVQSFGVPPQDILLDRVHTGPVRSADVAVPVEEEMVGIEVEEGLFYSPPQYEEAVAARKAEIEKATKKMLADMEKDGYSVEKVLAMIAAW